MKVDLTVEAPIISTPRVLQASAMFDLPPQSKSTRSWSAEVPIEDRPWNIGLVVGPSGSGKSQVSRHLWPDAVVETFDWLPDGSLLDSFPADMSIKDITGLLTSVGLGSVPAWLRPFRFLSNGEQFRATIARALAEIDGLVVLDEFTSVVDRQVAKVASHAFAKAVRRQKRQAVCVSCHYDIAPWLQPDWIFQPEAGRFEWKEPGPRPPFRLLVHEVDRTAWALFRDHHYMNPKLHFAAKCWGGFTERGDCVAFTSAVYFPHPRAKDIFMGHRLVVLPDYQGLGIGLAMDNWLGQWFWDRRIRYHNTVAHPAMIRAYSRSPRWKLTHEPGVNRLTRTSTLGGGTRTRTTRQLMTWSFEAPASAEERARIIGAPA